MWLGGLEVGQVVGIAFPEDVGGPAASRCASRSPKKYANRVREDSVVRLSSLGVLGEKAVDITLGSPEAAGACRTGPSCARLER